MSECVFCDRIAAGQYDWSDGVSVAFEPLNPVTPGHLLVVPRVHVEDARARPLVTGAVFSAAARLLQGLNAANLITSIGEAATQTIRHLHVHIVPRSAGDGLTLPWTGQKPRTEAGVCPLGTIPLFQNGDPQ